MIVSDATGFETTEPKEEEQTVKLKTFCSDKATSFEPTESIKEDQAVELKTFCLNKEESDSIFRENESFFDGKYDYPRKGNDPGLVLIFNQVNFRDELATKRTNSWRDVNHIISTFVNLGYRIKPKHVYEDLKQAEIFNAIKNVIAEDLSEVNCLVVFFLTHGTFNNKIMAYDKAFSVTNAWNMFKNCKDLKNKPKMFVVQACKNTTNVGNKSPKKTAQLLPYTTFSVNASMPDTLIVFSTTEGHVSFRNPLTGSWFIQELCRNISSYAKYEDVISIILRTNRAVATNYGSSDGTLQMPIFISTLNKRFFLTRSAERNFVLKMDRATNDVLASLTDIIDGLPTANT